MMVANRFHRKIIKLGIISAAVFAILACAALSPVTAPPPAPNAPTATSIPLSDQVTLTTTRAEEDSRSPVYKITTQTPVLTGMDDPRVKNFNTEMAALVTRAEGDFKQNLTDPNLIPVSEGSSFDVQYKLLSPPGKILSLKFEMEGYISGATHPYHLSQTVNYDLEQGKDITLADLFLPNAAYLQRISAYCIAQLKMRDIGFDPGIFQGADSTLDNYRNWNITADGLLITFDEYQVAAYAAGPQSVPVPYIELKTLIDLHGPLGKFVQ